MPFVSIGGKHVILLLRRAQTLFARLHCGSLAIQVNVAQTNVLCHIDLSILHNRLVICLLQIRHMVVDRATHKGTPTGVFLVCVNRYETIVNGQVADQVGIRVRHTQTSFRFVVPHVIREMFV